MKYEIVNLNYDTMPRIQVLKRLWRLWLMIRALMKSQRCILLTFDLPVVDYHIAKNEDIKMCEVIWQGITEKGLIYFLEAFLEQVKTIHNDNKEVLIKSLGYDATKGMKDGK